jgi:hypothetical protein
MGPLSDNWGSVAAHAAVGKSAGKFHEELQRPTCTVFKVLTSTGS